MVWGVFWSVLEMCQCFLKIGFSNIDWWALSMPSNFFSYDCACFSSFFLQVMMKELFDYYWKLYSPFSSFDPLLTVFWRSTLFVGVVVFCRFSVEPEIATARWWPCLCRKCVCSVGRLEKNWKFEMDTSLGPGAEMWSRHKLMKMDTLLLFSLYWWI